MASSIREALGSALAAEQAETREALGWFRETIREQADRIASERADHAAETARLSLCLSEALGFLQETESRAYETVAADREARITAESRAGIALAAIVDANGRAEREIQRLRAELTSRFYETAERPPVPVDSPAITVGSARPTVKARPKRRAVVNWETLLPGFPGAVSLGSDPEYATIRAAMLYMDPTASIRQYPNTLWEARMRVNGLPIMRLAETERSAVIRLVSAALADRTAALLAGGRNPIRIVPARPTTASRASRPRADHGRPAELSPTWDMD